MATTVRPRGRLYGVRNSPLHGKGAFALQSIPKGTVLGEYVGERITDDEADVRYPDDADGPHHTFLFALEDGGCIDAAVGGNSMRFLNHSCDPNCEAIEEEGRIFLQTIRKVKPGEELVYDYNFVLDVPHSVAEKKKYPCRCGSKNCRGTILAKKR